MANRPIPHTVLLQYVRHFRVGRTTTKLPVEVADLIAGFVDASAATAAGLSLHIMTPGNAPYWMPPATCMLARIPVELRREIFAESLPDREVIHRPKCDDRDLEVKNKKAKANACGLPPRGATTTLMLLNKRICSEVTELLYQERWFVIHVHDGLTTGGVEFLQAGRQPLHYQDGINDFRFSKFTRDSQFGFHRLKKIQIEIHPSEENTGRHMDINTYYMNLALCRLLDRGSDNKDRITSIVIKFLAPSKAAAATTGRRAIERAEQYWWDGIAQQPRSSSIHNISHVELALRPFANLTGCHTASVILPAKVAADADVCSFVSALENSMRSKSRTLGHDDHLELNLSRLRDEMEYYVNFDLAGKERKEMDRMTAEEFNEAGVLDVADDDGTSVDGSIFRKRRPFDDGQPGSVCTRKRQKSDPTTSDNKHAASQNETDDRLAKVVRQSKALAMHVEQQEIQQAIEASLVMPLERTSRRAPEIGHTCNMARYEYVHGNEAKRSNTTGSLHQASNNNRTNKFARTRPGVDEDTNDVVMSSRFGRGNCTVSSGDQSGQARSNGGPMPHAIASSSSLSHGDSFRMAPRAAHGVFSRFSGAPSEAQFDPALDSHQRYGTGVAPPTPTFGSAFTNSLSGQRQSYCNLNPPPGPAHPFSIPAASPTSEADSGTLRQNNVDAEEIFGLIDFTGG